ncbi:MAG: N-acetylmuramoyl-L-alanine amidase [Lachnospiraceae bacterium]|nr:N-acetylmuramoyl-L-alanine amidase [Lachnospiraceae bacterium]
MNELIKRIAIIAAIFLGAVVIMSLAAKVMMRADEKAAGSVPVTDVPPVTGTEPGGASSDAQPDSDAVQAGNDAAQTGDGTSDGTDTAPTGTADAAVTGTEPEPAVVTGTEPTSAPAGKHTVVIDAAHQSTNVSEKEPIGPGATQTKVKVTSGAEGTATDTPEYKMTLEVSLMLRDELVKRGYGVYMIRETNDVSISDAERARLANINGEIVLHIHGNADENEGIKGIMAFCPSDDNEFVSKQLAEKCKTLCRDILSEMEAETGAKNWGAIGHNGLTALNWTNIPAAHVELGYLSNAEEDRLLQTAEYREKLVRGIADGIDKYFGD